jgi:hypothetical protein
MLVAVEAGCAPAMYTSARDDTARPRQVKHYWQSSSVAKKHRSVHRMHAAVFSHLNRLPSRGTAQRKRVRLTKANGAKVDRP